MIYLPILCSGVAGILAILSLFHIQSTVVQQGADFALHYDLVEN
jgi:hypothetical protein